jgi:hypothetical protein
VFSPHRALLLSALGKNTRFAGLEMLKGRQGRKCHSCDRQTILAVQVQTTGRFEVEDFANTYLAMASGLRCDPQWPLYLPSVSAIWSAFNAAPFNN